MQGSLQKRWWKFGKMGTFGRPGITSLGGGQGYETVEYCSFCARFGGRGVARAGRSGFFRQQGKPGKTGGSAPVFSRKKGHKDDYGRESRKRGSFCRPGAG